MHKTASILGGSFFSKYRLRFEIKNRTLRQNFKDLINLHTSEELKNKNMNKILILDFGSQYTQLIARRVRELNVYSEIVPFHQLHNALNGDHRAIILSGSPFSVREEGAPQVDLSKIIGKIPVLGVCYGAQLMAQYHGGTVERSQKREYGKAQLGTISDGNDPLFKGINAGSQVWMSHGDTIFELPKGFEKLAETGGGALAAFRKTRAADGSEAPTYAIQFHPEVTHSLDGLALLRNFVIDIAGCAGDWTSASFVEQSVAEIRQKVGNDEVLLALSGGVDSSVAALLLHKAIGNRLKCFFVDNGLLRKNEFEDVLKSYEGMGLDVVGIDAKQRFYDALALKTDPEDKRKAIGHSFIEVFDEAAKQFPNVKWLAQGTIYPDVIESVSVHGPSVTIKSHHNVGGLPEKMNLKIVEPLRMLFKDEVRRVGKTLGLVEHILMRHPFPGPGLAIRILGDVTVEKVELLQNADKIFIDKLKSWNLYSEVWQAGAILLPIQSVGVMGDERTYERVLALRAVSSSDGMTAEWSRLPYDFLAEVSTEIINRVRGINRVVFDISTKPPATIEWE
jgi:GMP synthase (glutamine-hydrolysing)